jgi:hypothetical protein
LGHDAAASTPRIGQIGIILTMPTSTEAIIGVTTILVLVGTVLYFKMGGKPAKVADSKKTEGGSGDVGRQRSYSNMEEKYPAGKMCIYFGSQTGTAEGFARIVLSEGQKHGFDAKVHDLEDFEPEQLQSSRLAVFLVATYGEGDPYKKNDAMTIVVVTIISVYDGGRFCFS